MGNPKISEELMSATIPDSHADLFSKKAFGSLATLNADGTPQVTPVWVDREGDFILFNSARGRRKDKNIRRDPHVAIAIADPDNPYRYLEIRGRVVEITENSADDHINHLAKKYLGVDVYPHRQSGEVRVKYKVEPDHVGIMG
jgi:PPOX class probable F420-dependent enzyme